MGKIFAVLATLFGVIILFYMFPTFTNSLTDLREDPYAYTFTGVATGAGVTNASLSLMQPLYNDDIQFVVSYTSDNVADNPSTESYVTANDKLYVRGLAANTARNITVVWGVEALAQYTGLSEFTGLLPLLVMVAVIGLIAAVAWFAVKGKGR